MQNNPITKNFVIEKFKTYCLRAIVIEKSAYNSAMYDISLIESIY